MHNKTLYGLFRLMYLLQLYYLEAKLYTAVAVWDKCVRQDKYSEENGSTGASVKLSRT